MRKLALDMDRLEVESFPTTEADEAARGTVEGAMRTRELYCTGGETCRTSCGAPQCTCPV